VKQAYSAGLKPPQISPLSGNAEIAANSAKKALNIQFRMATGH